jgi:hypothetical protein
MDGLTPDEYMALLQLGGENADLDMQIALQQAQAKQARQRGEAPQGGMAGNVFVGPSWTQQLASLAWQKNARDADKSATDTGAKKNVNTQEQNKMIARALLAAQGNQSYGAE